MATLQTDGKKRHFFVLALFDSLVIIMCSLLFCGSFAQSTNKGKNNFRIYVYLKKIIKSPLKYNNLSLVEEQDVDLPFL